MRSSEQRGAPQAERPPPARSRRVADRSEEAIDAIAARLLARFGDRVTVEAIEEAVRAAYTDLDTNARIRIFLPVLTERVAAERIIDLLRRGRAGGPREAETPLPSGGPVPPRGPSATRDTGKSG